MALIIQLQRQDGQVKVDKGSSRAPDKNVATLSVLNSASHQSTRVELNREEAEALADALKKAVR